MLSMQPEKGKYVVVAADKIFSCLTLNMLFKWQECRFSKECGVRQRAGSRMAAQFLNVPSGSLYTHGAFCVSLVLLTHVIDHVT